MQGIWRLFFLGRRWINNQRKSNSARCNTLHIKIIELICCARRLLKVTKSRLNDRICQHCGVKTSTVTPSFYYVFNIYSSCNNSIRSLMGNLWRVLLLGNHLKQRQNWRLVKNEFIFYKRKSRFSISVRYANGSKTVMVLWTTAFNSKWKYEELAMVVHVP